MGSNSERSGPDLAIRLSFWCGWGCTSSSKLIAYGFDAGANSLLGELLLLSSLIGLLNLFVRPDESGGVHGQGHGTPKEILPGVDVLRHDVLSERLSRAGNQEVELLKIVTAAQRFEAGHNLRLNVAFLHGFDFAGTLKLVHEAHDYGTLKLSCKYGVHTTERIFKLDSEEANL
ncbi:MAG TPA: hypothetical protein VM537_21675, partial [Anaerolineae bacterium]|nr:hypothetical protein [Anaerolineae bacterium]